LKEWDNWTSKKLKSLSTQDLLPLSQWQ